MVFLIEMPSFILYILTTTLKDVIESIKLGDTNKYSRFNRILYDHPELIDDFDWKWLYNMRNKISSGKTFQVFIGGKGSKTTLHCATENNLFTQVFGEKLNRYITPVNSALNTPVWYRNDWTPDQVFFIYEMEVSNPSAYVKEFADFSQKLAASLGYENNSYGVGYPISGKKADFSHFVWIGSPDLETALSRTKEMQSTPEFAKFSAKVSGIRKVINTYMMVRVADF